MKLKHITILLVEDSLIISFATAELLHLLGYHVIIAHDGNSAIERFKENEIDLILSDYDLGSGLNGIESSRTILSIKDVPLIFYTSHSANFIHDNASDLPHYGVLDKNLELNQLDKSIKEAFKSFNSKFEFRR